MRRGGYFSAMVHLVTGQPGNGKTLACVHFILRSLINDPKAIVATNIALFDGPFAGYLRERGVMDCWDRVCKLGHDEVLEFYKYATPVNGSALPHREFRSDQQGNVIPVAIPRPVIYVIDEAHLYWNARNYQKTGTAVLSYVSQHRHLGDTIVLITQHPDQLDKAFRRLVDEWWSMLNLEKRRIMGFKGAKGWFVRSVFFKPPSLLDRASEKHRFKIDMDVAATYDTTAGKRFGDAPGDTGQKKKGLPMWLGILIVVAVVVLAWWGFSKVPRLLGKMVGGMMAGTREAVVQATTGTNGMSSSVGQAFGIGASPAAPGAVTSSDHAPVGEWVTVTVVDVDKKKRGGKVIEYRTLRDVRIWTNTQTKVDAVPVRPVTVAQKSEGSVRALANPDAKAYARPYVVDVFGTKKIVKPYESAKRDGGGSDGFPSGTDRHGGRIWDEGRGDAWDIQTDGSPYHQTQDDTGRGE